MKKHQVIQKLEQAWTALQESYAELSDAQFTEPGIILPVALLRGASPASVFPHELACSPTRRLAVLSSARTPLGGRRRRGGTRRPVRVRESRKKTPWVT